MYHLNLSVSDGFPLHKSSASLLISAWGPRTLRTWTKLSFCPAMITVQSKPGNVRMRPCLVWRDIHCTWTMDIVEMIWCCIREEVFGVTGWFMGPKINYVLVDLKVCSKVHQTDLAIWIVIMDNAAGTYHIINTDPKKIIRWVTRSKGLQISMQAREVSYYGWSSRSWMTTCRINTVHVSQWMNTLIYI